MNIDDFIEGWKKRKNKRKQDDINKTVLGEVKPEDRAKLDQLYRAYKHDMNVSGRYEKTHRLATIGFRRKKH